MPNTLVVSVFHEMRSCSFGFANSRTKTDECGQDDEIRRFISIKGTTRSKGRRVLSSFPFAWSRLNSFRGWANLIVYRGLEHVY
jgi:hypothetical protein